MKDAKPTTPSLGETIRQLLKEQDMRAFELGEQIGLSPTSISKLMNGISSPRQNTFSKLCQVLCRSQADERRLVQAYTGTVLPEERAPRSLSRAPASHQAKDREILRMRSEQYLERKTQSIQFKRSVARTLDEARIAYQADYCAAPYSTDFLIERHGQRIALECKSNVGRDRDKTQMIVSLLQQGLDCARVLIVVPYADDDPAGASVSVAELVAVLDEAAGE